MTSFINMHEAKTHFSELIQRSLQGQDIVISKFGKPMIRLVPYEAPPKARKAGQWKNKVKIRSDFDELPKDFLDDFATKE